MSKEKYLIFDKGAISSLKHNINHTRRSLQYMPKPIATMQWDCEIFKKKVSLDSNLKYIMGHLDAVLRIIELSEQTKEK